MHTLPPGFLSILSQLLPEKTFPTDADVPGKSDLLSILSQLPHVQEPVPATVMADDLSILSQLLPSGSSSSSASRSSGLSILSQLLHADEAELEMWGYFLAFNSFSVAAMAKARTIRVRVLPAFNSFSVAARARRHGEKARREEPFNSFSVAAFVKKPVWSITKNFQFFARARKLALKALKVFRDRVGIISSLKPTSRDESYFFVDQEPRVRDLGDRARSSLESICRRLAECKNANVDEAVKDVKMYIAPYIDLVEAGYRAVLVTGDACFRELVNSYAQLRGSGLGAVGVDALLGSKRLVRALRSISSISL